MEKKRFPIQGGFDVSWSAAERAYARYAEVFGKEQSIERMAERGGFGLLEFFVFYTKAPCRATDPIWKCSLGSVQDQLLRVLREADFRRSGRVENKTKMIHSVQDLAEHMGEDPDESRMSRRLYKSTDCGAWLRFEWDQAGTKVMGVCVGSIVEGVEQCAETRHLTFPFTEHDWDDAVQAVEDDVDQIWAETHGCDQCGTETETGHIPINPDCSGCGGHGTVI